MIPIGARVPRRGNAFSRWFGRMVLRLMGWRVQGEIPDEPRFVMIGAPHTSNMDGVMAIIVLTALGLRASTMIKDTAFKGALGVILRWVGAIPINRRSPKGVVEQSVETFKANPALILLIAAEGTRGAAKEWKRGFYHIARNAGVPIVLGAPHYARKIITFGHGVMPAGDFEADFGRILEFYRQHGWPRHPEGASKPICEVMGLPWRPRADED